jgi:hypothetical protein
MLNYMSEEIVLEVIPEVIPEVDKSKVVLGEPIVRSVSVLAFHLRVLDLVLGQSVRFAIYLDCESDGKIFRDYKEIMIDGADYLAWGTDDAYVVELVKSRLASVL